MQHLTQMAATDGAPPAAVRAQLGRMLASASFARAPRLRRFLSYIVDEALAGRFERLKEYSLGVDVFDRGAAFDPKTDPIVRVDARRLRRAIGDYYAGEGAGDPVEIELPTGSYQPLIRLRAAAGPARRRPGARLAVAGFESQSDNVEARGFAVGLSDELLLALTGRPELQVVAATRTGTTEEPAALARRLGADMALSGKVAVSGGRLRVRASLTAAADGAQLWADRYDASIGAVGELIALQDDLARRIAGLVAPRLRTPWRGRAQAPTQDAEAYELFLRGRHQLAATTPASLGEAFALLEAAAARDPAFAEPLAALAEAHFLQGVFLQAAPIQAFTACRRCAHAALELDPELPAAHASLARVSAALDHDPIAAEASMDRALAGDQLSAGVRQTRAFWLLAPLGRLDEALAELAALLAQDPYALRLRFDYARTLVFQRRFADAIHHLELVLEFQPSFPGAVFALAFAYERAGRLDAAREAHRRHVRELPYPLVARWLEAAEAVWDGAPDRARAIVEAMDAEATPLAATVMADAWLRLGDHDRTIGWLEAAADACIHRVLFLSVDPDYAALHGQPRFARLLRRLGLPDPLRAGTA